jgi:hypothetical protein
MSDPNRIEEMIAAEPDSKNRAFLLILNNINKALVENTEATRETRAELAAHVQRFEAHTEQSRSLVDKGRGAWKVAAWAFGILQVVGLGMWSDSQKEQKEIRAAVQQDQIAHARFDQRIEILERKKP